MSEECAAQWEDFHEVLVKEIRYESEDVVSIRLDALNEQLPVWEPGAHIDIRVSDGSTRQYSLCGEPEDPHYRIAVLRELDGRGGSEFLHRELRVGDLLSIKGPRQHFGLEDSPEAVLIAGGVGITPLRPMAKTLHDQGSTWSLYYYGSSRSRMAFADELEQLGGNVYIFPKDEGPRPELAEVAARGDQGTGYYVCGPERMLTGVQEALAGREVQLHTELFAAPDAVDEAPKGTFAVELQSTGQVLSVAPDESILHVVNSAGAEVMSDCEEGICGSCETDVAEGAIDHRDHVLTPQERAAGDCMMLCVSRAAEGCPKLVLEL